MNASRRTLYLCAVAHGLNHSLAVLFTPLYRDIQHDFALRGLSLGLLIASVHGVMYGGLAYPFGYLADRWSKRWLIAIGLIVNAFAIIACGLSPSYIALLIFVASAGIAGSIYHPTANAWLPHLAPSRKGYAFGIHGIGSSIGFVLAPILSGWVADVANWRWSCIAFGILALCVAPAFIWLTTDDTDDAHDALHEMHCKDWIAKGSASAVNASEHKGEPSSTLNIPLWQLIGFLAVLFGLRDCAGVGVMNLSPVFLQSVYGLQRAISGLAVAVMMLPSAFAQPLMGSISDKWGRFRSLFIILLMSAVLVAALPFVGLGGFWILLFGYGFFVMGSVPIVDALIADVTPTHARGRVFGLVFTIAMLISSIAPYFAGRIVDAFHGLRIGYQAVYLCFAAIALAAPLWAWLGRALYRYSQRQHNLTIAK